MKNWPMVIVINNIKKMDERKRTFFVVYYAIRTNTLICNKDLPIYTIFINLPERIMIFEL